MGTSITSHTRALEYLKEIGIANYVRAVDYFVVASTIRQYVDSIWHEAEEEGFNMAIDDGLATENALIQRQP